MALKKNFLFCNAVFEYGNMCFGEFIKYTLGKSQSEYKMRRGPTLMKEEQICNMIFVFKLFFLLNISSGFI